MRNSDEDYTSGRGTEKPCRSCVDPRTWFKNLAGIKHNERKRPNPDRSARTDNTDDSKATASVVKESAKASGQQHDQPASSSSSHGISKPCPAFVDELGRASWTFLHTMAARYPENPTSEQKRDAQEFMQLFAKLYPCDVCAADLRRDLEKLPIDVTSQGKFATWMCSLHNLVNEKLGKPQFDCKSVRERWKDGWDDGSCD